MAYKAYDERAAERRKKNKQKEKKIMNSQNKMPITFKAKAT